jgi:hypothetical protein
MARKPQPLIGFNAYDADEWQAILAVRRNGWPQDADLDQMQRDLELAGRMYWQQRERRVRMSMVQRRRLLRARRQVKELRRLVYDLMRQIPRSDPFLPQRAFDGLREIDRTIEPRLALHEIYASKLFKGRRDVHREFLLQGVLQSWSAATGDRALGYSRTRALGPTGPLIAFLQAALGPILGGQAPNAETLATAIKRERRKRAPG